MEEKPKKLSARRCFSVALASLWVFCCSPCLAKGPLAEATLSDPIPAIHDYVRRLNQQRPEDARIPVEDLWIAREYPVADLQQTVGVRLFLVNGEMLFAYGHGQVRKFGLTFGGHGLMSAVVLDKALFYTYSFGSGLHRSHVGRMTFEDGAFRILESCAYFNHDLFVVKTNQGIRIDVGDFEQFNSWRPIRRLGRPELCRSSLVIVQEVGAEIDTGLPGPCP